MNFHHIRQVCLILLASLILTFAESQQPLTANVNVIDDKLPEKPEPRQIGAVLPYAWLQSAQAPPPSTYGSSLPSWMGSSGQSLLSILKPSMTGGRRSSLTSRLRNLMNALFYRRETTSPYLASGSSYSYAFRPPPFGFGASGFPTSSGIASALGSSNLYGAASSYRPVVLPNYPSPQTDAWSNYKQYASNPQTSIPSSYSSSQFAQSSPTNWNSGSSGSPSQSSAIWQSGSQSGTGSSYSGLSSSSYPSYSSGSSSSNSGYQAAASNAYPNTSYQRSSNVSYGKPQQSGSSYPNGSVSSSVSSDRKSVV